jgi:hypothetical protein
MNRRDFLRVTVLASTALFLSSYTLKTVMKPPVQASAAGRTFRGTPDGEVLVSEDGGKTWKLHARFGPEIPILAMAADRSGGVSLQAGYKSHSFRLVLSKNGRNWMVEPNSSSVL